eukprot:1274776-Pyramimonas_sp.AAC.1
MVFDPWAPSSAIYGCHQDGFNERPRSAIVKPHRHERPRAGPIGGGSVETAIGWVAHDQKV